MLQTLDEIDKTLIIQLLLSLALTPILYTALSRCLETASSLTQVTKTLSLLLLMHIQSHSACYSCYRKRSDQKLFAVQVVYQTQTRKYQESNYRLPLRKHQSCFASLLLPSLNSHIKSGKRQAKLTETRLYRMVKIKFH